MEAQAIGQRGCFDRVGRIGDALVQGTKKWGGQLWAGLHEFVVIGVSLGLRKGVVELVAAHYPGADHDCDASRYSVTELGNGEACRAEMNLLLGQLAGHAASALWIGASALVAELGMRRFERARGIASLEAEPAGPALYHNTRQLVLLGSFVGGSFLQSRYEQPWLDAAVTGAVAGANVVLVPMIATCCDVVVNSRPVDPERRVAPSMLLAGAAAGLVGGLSDVYAQRMLPEGLPRDLGMHVGGSAIRFFLCWGVLRRSIEACTNPPASRASWSQLTASVQSSARTSMSQLQVSAQPSMRVSMSQLATSAQALQAVSMSQLATSAQPSERPAMSPREGVDDADQAPALEAVLDRPFEAGARQEGTMEQQPETALRTPALRRESSRADGYGIAPPSRVSRADIEAPSRPARGDSMSRLEQRLPFSSPLPVMASLFSPAPVDTSNRGDGLRLRTPAAESMPGSARRAHGER